MHIHKLCIYSRSSELALHFYVDDNNNHKSNGLNLVNNTVRPIKLWYVSCACDQLESSKQRLILILLEMTSKWFDDIEKSRG